MKKTVLLLACFTAMCSQAQTSSTIKIDSCSGNSGRPADIVEANAFLNVMGLNLNKYDFSDPKVNCHINNLVEKRKSLGLMRTLSLMTVTTGASLFLLGAVMPDNGGSGKGAMMGLGAACIGVSIPCFIGKANSKKKSNYHMSQIAEYYRQKGW